MGVRIASLVAALIASLLIASEPLLILVAAALVVYLWLLSGFLVIAPVNTKKRKVFCIGLSRTGTTSITVALKKLGFEAHHQCHALVERGPAGKPKVCKFWAEAFDAHADIAPATVFEELAASYPDARFVFTQREPSVWAHAMLRFVGKFKLLLESPPVARMFADCCTLTTRFEPHMGL